MPAATTHKELRTIACAKLDAVHENLTELEIALIRGHKRDIIAALRLASKDLLEAITLIRVPVSIKKERAA